jgi:hypothetical protein
VEYLIDPKELLIIQAIITETLLMSKMSIYHSINFSNFYSSICLIRTATTIAIGTTNVQVINLPTAATEAINVGTAGWGAIRHNGPAPNQLQTLDKRTLTHTDCIGRVGSHSWMNVNKICTLPIRAGSGTHYNFILYNFKTNYLKNFPLGVCGGDSGGPIYTGSTVIGLVSWGFVPCGGTGRPDVHERVFSHLTWIRNTMA